MSDLFAPLAGEVDGRPTTPWPASPELVNSDPYGDGWMVRLRIAGRRQLDDLLDADAYDALVAAG